jgi:hypothetical protein
MENLNVVFVISTKIKPKILRPRRRVMHGYPIRRLPVPVPETADHGAGTGREMRARVRVRIVNFHVLTRPRVFAHRLPYSAQYVDGVVSTLRVLITCINRKLWHDGYS